MLCWKRKIDTPRLIITPPTVRGDSSSSDSISPDQSSQRTQSHSLPPSPSYLSSDDGSGGEALSESGNTGRNPPECARTASSMSFPIDEEHSQNNTRLMRERCHFMILRSRRFIFGMIIMLIVVGITITFAVVDIANASLDKKEKVNTLFFFKNL